ncbi:MAG: YvcK family protein [Nitrososphaerota archaeon]|nr:YvcK family protein [Nitrososphaerota archaeon]MDG6922393.1 YvcK family protein [Nitrososphaerota archaeon]
MKRVGVICGGSGSSKFANAFSDYSNEKEELDLGFITNVADNFWYHDLYVCPDVDIIIHALAGNLDMMRGWGVSGDTFTAQDLFSRVRKEKEWFNLGDFDSALCRQRSELLKSGWKLSTVTDHFCKIFKINHRIIPSTDDVEVTFVLTNSGMMHLQQYWVEHKGIPKVKSVSNFGATYAKASTTAISYVSPFTIICPANPVTSIMPCIRLSGLREALKKTRVIAISPFVGDKPFSGPAAQLMCAAGFEPNSLGVARLYSAFLDLLILDSNEDRKVFSKIRDLGIECIMTNTRIDEDSKMTIAEGIMNSL